jgi:hypothetical protein
MQYVNNLELGRGVVDVLPFQILDVHPTRQDIILVPCTLLLCLHRNGSATLSVPRSQAVSLSQEDSLVVLAKSA